MKTITSSVAFQDEAGNPLANGSLILTLPAGVYEIAAGGGQVVGQSVTVNLNNLGKIPGTPQIWASDELSPQVPYTVTICGQANGLGAVASATWLITGVSPIDLSQMVSTQPGLSFAAPVVYDVAQGGSLQAAYNAKAAAGGGTVNVPPNYTETLAANLVLNSNNTGFLFWGPSLIKMGSFQIIISPGTSGAFIRTLNAGASNTGAVTPEFTYNGSADAFKVGDATGDLSGIYIEGISVVLSQGGVAAGASATAMRLTRVQNSKFDRLFLGGAANGHIPLLLDGSVTFTGDNHFSNIRAGLGGFSGSTIKLQNQSVLNVFNTVDVSNAAGVGIGIDMTTGNVASNVFNGVDVEGLATALSFGAGANQNRLHGVWFELNTVDISWGTSANNYVQAGAPAGVGPIQTGGSGGGNIAEVSPSRTLNQQGASGAVTGTGVDVALFSYTIPANTLGPGRGLRIRALYQHTTGTTAVLFKLKFGSTVLQSQTYGTAGSVVDVAEWTVYNNSGVMNAQTWMLQELIDLTGSSLTPASATGTAAIDFTTSQVLSYTFNVPNTDQMTPKWWSVELI